jgi:hypothetical protein
MTVAVIGQVREYREIASPNTVVDLAPLIVHAPRMPVSTIWRQVPSHLLMPRIPRPDPVTDHQAEEDASERKCWLSSNRSMCQMPHMPSHSFIQKIELTVICQCRQICLIERHGPAMQIYLAAATA